MLEERKVAYVEVTGTQQQNQQVRLCCDTQRLTFVTIYNFHVDQQLIVNLSVLVNLFIAPIIKRLIDEDLNIVRSFYKLLQVNQSILCFHYYREKLQNCKRVNPSNEYRVNTFGNLKVSTFYPDLSNRANHLWYTVAA